MDQSEVLKHLGDVGALIKDSHIVYTKGDHGTAYINKDAVYPHTHLTAELCREIATEFRGQKIEVVIGPAMGGIILSTWVGYFLQSFNTTHAVKEVHAIFAEKGSDGFFFRSAFKGLVRGKRVLIVEDILNTGGSVVEIVQLAKAHDGKVIGVAALANRGGVTADMLCVPELHSLVNVTMDKWPADKCPLCRDNVPINTDVGHGKKFLASR